MVYDPLVGLDEKVYDVDLDVLSHYTDFISGNGFLYENLKPISKVAWVYSFSSKFNTNIKIEDWEGGDYDFNWTFQGMSRILIESNIQNDALFFNDDRFSNITVKSEQLAAYDCIILPNTFSITDQQVQLLLDYVQNGGTIIASGHVGTHDELGRKANRPILQSFMTPGTHSHGNGFFVYYPENIGSQYKGTGDASYRETIVNEVNTYVQPQTEVLTDGIASVFAYKKEGTSDMILHLVNYDYDPPTDAFDIKENFIVKVLIDTSKSWEAVSLSPDFYGQKVLSTTYNNGYINITIPRLEAYNIIVLQENQESPQITTYKPQADTTILAGEPLELSIEATDPDGNPLFFEWSVNSKVDSSATGSTYSSL